MRESSAPGDYCCRFDLSGKKDPTVHNAMEGNGKRSCVSLNGIIVREWECTLSLVSSRQWWKV